MAMLWIWARCCPFTGEAVERQLNNPSDTIVSCDMAFVFPLNLSLCRRILHLKTMSPSMILHVALVPSLQESIGGLGLANEPVGTAGTRIVGFDRGAEMQLQGVEQGAAGERDGI